MKTFQQLRELKGKHPPGEHISAKKVKGVSTMIHKDKGKFVAYIDGDRLDSYPTLRQAERMIDVFIKNYKG